MKIKKKQIKHNQCDFHRLHRDDVVVVNSCIETDNAYWPLKSLSTVKDLGRLNSVAVQHSRWLWLILHCCNEIYKKKIESNLNLMENVHTKTHTYHNSVFWSCCRASPKASDAATVSRGGNSSNCDPIDWKYKAHKKIPEKKKRNGTNHFSFHCNHMISWFV